MFCRDTLCDTTPAVIDFLNGLSTAASKSPCSGDGALQHGHNAQSCMPVMGHVFLSSLLCVSRLARKRQLLLKSLKPSALPPRASATPSMEGIAVQSPSAAGAGDTVFVRLVLSLLGHALMRQATMAPCAAAPGDNASLQAAPLPWWPATSAPSESAQDFVYDVQCVGDEDDRAGDNVGFSEEHAPGVGHTPFTASTSVHCRIVLRSHPVAIFSPAMMSELTLDAEQRTSVASRTGCHGGAPGADSSEAVDAEAVSGSCVARALEVFDARVRDHEEACLRQIAEIVGSLQRLLEKPATEVQSPGGLASTGFPSESANGDASRLGGCASPLHEWTIDVPIYGVVLCIEDTHATRLERVRRLTTPLLQAATGCGNAAGGPLGPVTQVLSKLHTWCAASTAASFTSSASPDAFSCVPGIRTITRMHVTELRQLVDSHLKDSQTAAARLPGPAYPATVGYDASQALAAPACVVHCQLGVSRSPSVVMLFYMDVLASQLRAAASAAEAPLDIYHGLLNALVQARHQVRPNVCFSAQLLSLWRRSMQLDTPASPTRVV
ncbi:Dual specificity phosphatase, catalytic domain containing protein, putative [Leishmania donovani]|uniref:Dual specificity phosphatase, catalytic domain containing protein, putative n=1 Tax=Leishmania donovani TaxID=5661 RepID=A0A3S7WSG2_LEIDO|nr:Dual specificity phosphatase, catalytic domain containing protein, putative [Leishmania donovani]